MSHVSQVQEYLVILIFAYCAPYLPRCHGLHSPQQFALKEICYVYIHGGIWVYCGNNAHNLLPVQYSEANLKWGLQVRFKDPQRAPEYLYFSENKTEVDTVYRKLNEKISAHRLFGARD